MELSDSMVGKQYIEFHYLSLSLSLSLVEGALIECGKITRDLIKSFHQSSHSSFSRNWFITMTSPPEWIVLITSIMTIFCFGWSWWYIKTSPLQRFPPPRGLQRVLVLIRLPPLPSRLKLVSSDVIFKIYLCFNQNLSKIKEWCKMRSEMTRLCLKMKVS